MREPLSPEFNKDIVTGCSGVAESEPANDLEHANIQRGELFYAIHKV